MNEPEKRRRWGRISVVVVILALTLMWIYALFVVSPDATSDKLSSSTFPQAAEPVCASTLAELQRLGVVNQKAASPQARADLVDTTDAQLRTMVQKLRTLVPPAGEDATAISKWLDDWDQWLRDRTTWAEKLHRGEDAAFLEKQRPDTGEPNSKAMDAFAVTNSMRSCSTPAGV